MSHSFNLNSHSDKLLKDHLGNVGKLSKEIVKTKEIANNELFSEIAYYVGISHDFGKSTIYFQNLLKNNKRTGKSRHGFISSLFGYLVVKTYLLNLEKLDEFWYLPGIVWVVINKHHGNLGNILNEELPKLKDPNNLFLAKDQFDNIIFTSLEKIKKIYESLGYPNVLEILNELEDIEKLEKVIYRDVKKICLTSFKESKLDYYFIILFFYSVLLDADKLDASELERIPEKIEIHEKDIVDHYKSVRFNENENGINRIREMAYQEVNSQISNLNLNTDRILSINLPTGLGKTLAAFSFALGLQGKIQDEMGFNPKIIYSLPFLSIIDQNSSIIAEILTGRDKKGWNKLLKMEKNKRTILLEENVPSNLLLKHHYLADIQYKEEKDDELNIIEDINKSLLLTEGWHSEIVITTFVQFFHSLITNRNRVARKFHNIINSIIILDEIQSIPHKYWLLINKMLKYLAYEFNCWIILMTATKPLIFGENETKELVMNKNTYFEFSDRVDFNFDLNEKTFEEFKEEIFNKILKENKDIMVVLNTIKSSKELYNYLKENLSGKLQIKPNKLIDNDGICNFPDLELINLSTHILPKYRLNKIDRMKNDAKRKVIITTQLVEAGVDISVDIIYRDLAPLDSIIQTAGRCNRNDEDERGLVNIIVLKDKKKEFYKYVYDPTLIDATKEVIALNGSSISEKNFTLKAADEYYRLVKERGSEQDSREIIDHLKKLEFSDTSKFQLIKQDFPKTYIFVEINDEAKKIRKSMEKIYGELNGFERKNRLLKIRKYINSFTLSIGYVNEYKDKIDGLCSIGEIEDFKYVAEKDLDDWYKLDIGLWPPDSDIDQRIL